MDYFDTYSCGHTGEFTVYGKEDYREWRVEKEYSGLCPDCREKQKEKEREEALLAAKKRAAEMGLPDLEGSCAQSEWAIRIRDEFITHSEALLENKIKEKEEQENILMLEKAVKNVLASTIEASFWIDTRFGFDTVIKKEYELVKNEKDWKKTPKEVEKELALKEKMLTVKTENSSRVGIVKFTRTKYSVSARYIKDENFICLAKKCNYRWNSDVWEHEINEYTGSTYDREAELGSYLLKDGFIVCFSCMESKEKAISATFEKETTDWVKWKDKKLFLVWKYNPLIYDEARKITSAKYKDGGIQVNIEFYEEVLDFAEVYGFKVGTRAKEEIESYLKNINSLEEITPMCKEEINEDVSLLKEKLESTGIIEELKDND